MRVNAGMIYLNGGRTDLAEQHLKQATSLNPALLQAWSLLCMLYRNQNRLQEMNWALQTLAQINPQAAQALHAQLMNPMQNPQSLLHSQAAQWLQAQPPPQPPPLGWSAGAAEPNVASAAENLWSSVGKMFRN